MWYVDDLVVWDPGSIASIALTGDFPSSYDHTFSAPDTHTVKVTFTDAEEERPRHIPGRCKWILRMKSVLQLSNASRPRRANSRCIPHRLRTSR